MKTNRCKHMRTEEGEHRGYTAGVAVYPYTHEWRPAHGCITVEVRCLDCGAVRAENHNGGHVEVSPWRPGEAREEGRR